MSKRLKTDVRPEMMKPSQQTKCNVFFNPRVCQPPWDRRGHKYSAIISKSSCQCSSRRWAIKTIYSAYKKIVMNRKSQFRPAKDLSAPVYLFCQLGQLNDFHYSILPASTESSFWNYLSRHLSKGSLLPARLLRRQGGIFLQDHRLSLFRIDPR